MTNQEYEDTLDEFYQIDDDPEVEQYYEQTMAKDDTKYFIHKLDSTASFYRVWDQMVNDPEEVEKLRSLFGSEFNHINNHYKKIKDTQ